MALVTPVAMESTAAYWKPIYNLLEGDRLELLVVNAQHIKQVPGCETDVKGAEWIAQLLRHGLLRAAIAGLYRAHSNGEVLEEVARTLARLGVDECARHRRETSRCGAYEGVSLPEVRPPHKWVG